MRFSCDECYEMRQPSIGKCPECGQNTLISKVSGWSMVSECTNCHWEVVSAGGFPQSCVVDDELYSIRIAKPDNSNQMIQLSKILVCNVLDLKKEFDSGFIERKFKVLKCIEMNQLINKLGIACEMDPQIHQIYKRALNCEYNEEHSNHRCTE